MEAQLQIISPELEKSYLQEALQAQNLKIETKNDYELGQSYMAKIKERIKMLEEERMAQTRPLDASKKRIMDFFKVPIQRLEDAKTYLNRVMVKWVDEQEMKRREEERRLQEEARKRAEEQALQEALELEKEGNKVEAEKVLEEPVFVPSIKVVSEIPKSKESHIRETWSAELISLKDLVEAIVAGKAPLMAVKADLVFLNEQARSYKQALRIPGVKAVSKKTQI